MGAASCDLPALVMPGGPMLNGQFEGRAIGSGTDLWQFSEDLRAGRMSQQRFFEAESCMSRSIGHCNTMGTASTMAAMMEALGLTLPQGSSIPAADSRRWALAHMAGRTMVEMIREDRKMSLILTRDAFENAIRVNAALGGSTNAVIHLIAIAGRIGVGLTLDDWDSLGRDVRTIVNLKPSGSYLMEDYYYAGGLPAVLRCLGEQDRLHRDALTVNGKSLWENCREAPNWNPEVIRAWEKPLAHGGGIAVLRGNLAPDGAVLKPSAASAQLLRHRGRAVVFEDIEHYKSRIEDPDLDVDEHCVLVLKNCGPRGYPGMAEVGNMGLPKKLLQKGVMDMVRISDARMSGTAYGTVVLHVCPEAAVGGPLALVQDGDMIELDVEHRRLELAISAEELARRRVAWSAPLPARSSGYESLYVQHVLQADLGADFDFLRGRRGAEVVRESH